MNWDLRYPHTDAIRSAEMPKRPEDEPKGLMVPPGEYTATLVKLIDGVSTELASPQTFMVKRMKEGALKGSSPEETAAFWRELENINLELSSTNVVVKETQDQLKLMVISLGRSRTAPGELDKKLHDLITKLQTMSKQLNGDPLRNQVGEKSLPTIGSRVSVAAMGTRNSTYGPTPTHKQSLAIARKQLDELRDELDSLLNDEIPAIEKALKAVKAPGVKGGGLR